MNIPGLPENPQLMHVFQRFRVGLEPLLALHDALLRDPAPLSPGDREMIAAYVSGQNSCGYCFGAHVAIAGTFGVDPDVFDQLMADVDSAPVDDRLKPILHYVRKLTLTPSRMTQADADVVFAAGWDEDALYCAVTVCALFNYMNRIIEGMGVTPGEQPASRPPEMLRGPYSQILGMLEP